ncbi:MAG TPA: hypothetical protein DEB31_02460 [Clostridiales bacterium]|nr:hypothetical protein [Clostridiales bacterium]
MIFYFTATGNSLYAAQSLQKQLGGDMYSIPNLLRQGPLTFTAQPGEYVGFVFPIFYWGLPDILPRFTAGLTINGAAPERTFILATGGGATGTACEDLEKALAKCGIEAGYKFSVRMGSNYVPEFTMPGPEKVERLLNAADGKLAKFAALIKSGKTGDYNKSKGPLYPLVSPIAQRMYPRDTSRFYADGACTGCGQCERVCPVSAIRVEGGSPRWVKARCETCLACLHRCPAQAIQYKKDMRKRGRYVNPRVIFAETQ